MQREEPDTEYDECDDCGCEEELEVYVLEGGTRLMLCDPCRQQRLREDTDDPGGVELEARLAMDNDG